MKARGQDVLGRLPEAAAIPPRSVRAAGVHQSVVPEGRGLGWVPVIGGGIVLIAFAAWIAGRWSGLGARLTAGAAVAMAVVLALRIAPVEAPAPTSGRRQFLMAKRGRGGGGRAVAPRPVRN